MSPSNAAPALLRRTEADGNAFDPDSRPELFRDVRRRRILAFLIDALIIATLVFGAAIVVFFFGALTLGLGWALYAGLVPTVAVLYVALTISSRQATWGMAAMGLTMRMWYGDTPNFWIGAAHAILFWAFNGLLPILIFIPSLLDARKRLVHDMVLGVVVMDERSVAALG